MQQLFDKLLSSILEATLDDRDGFVNDVSELVQRRMGLDHNSGDQCANKLYSILVEPRDSEIVDNSHA